MIKAQTSIDPKLISMLGRKLYSSSPLVIIVRELLQNSVDACNRAGVTPKIVIGIDQVGIDDITIFCDDNGCGMSPEEIVDDFLCLGGTSKRGTTATGGFGIAKAAIMSGYYWSVETLDWAVDYNDILDGGDIRVAEFPREGTRVTVKIHESCYSYNFINMLEMIYTSNVDIELIVNSSQISSIHDEHAGLHQEINPIFSSEKWEGFGTGRIDIPGRTISAKSFIRLNGLTQFQYSTYGDKRESNLFIEIYTNESPDSSKYPLTVSREKLTDVLSTEVYTWLRTFEGEAQATDDQIRRITLPDKVKILPGNLLYGERSSERDHTNRASTDEVRRTTSDDNHKLLDLLAQIRTSREEALEALQDYVDEKSKSSILMLMNYFPTSSNTKRDSNILAVWNSLLKMVIPEGDPFGTGLIGDINTKAMIERSTDVPFFLVNPEYLGIHSTSEKAIIISLWTSVCHEIAHITEGRHDSDFCNTWTTLMSLTSDDLIESLDILSDALKGKVL